MSDRTLVQHTSAVFGGIADSLLLCPINMESNVKASEQLWAKRIGQQHFRICCIPFYILGLSLDDEVSTTENNEVATVRRKSGHRTLRIAIREGDHSDSDHEAVHSWIESARMQAEWDGPMYVVADLPDESHNPDLGALEDAISKDRIWIHIS